MADTIAGNNTSLATLSLNTSSSSSIDFVGDSDWWKVGLVSGYGYFVNLQGWDTGGGTLLDPWLWIYNSSGLYVAYDDDTGYGLNSYIYFAPSSTGTYFLAAEESGSNGVGTYTISLYYDFLASTTTAESVGVGSGGTSSIDFYGDGDWVGISLVAGQTYVFDLKGSATSSGTLADPWLGIANSSGQLLWSDNNSGVGLNSQIIFTAPSSGTYYLEAYEANNSGVGTYALTTSNMSSVATTLAVGGSVSGNLQSASEIDVFKVTATAGTLLTVTFDAPSGITGSPFEIQVIDSSGPKITDWVTGSDYSFNVGSPSGGTAYITVSPNTSYSAGQYGITVTSESLDYGTVPTSTIKPLTGDVVIDATTHGYFWALNAPHVVTWAIADSTSSYWLDPNGAMAGVQAIFSNFEDVADIHFKGLGYYSSVEAANALGADIVISLDGANAFFSNSNQWARAFFPSNRSIDNPYAGAGGDVWINVNSPANTLSYAPGSAGYFLALHEFGHALGLKHPHDDGGTGHPTYSQAGIGGFNFDWATVMSYSDSYDWNLREWDPSTLMPLDVIGIQSIYGANTSANNGNNTYSLVADNYYQTIWDSAGIDLVSAVGASEGWVIALPSIQLAATSTVLTGYGISQSDFQLVSPHTLYWLMGEIENASGSEYDDKIVGNGLNNWLTGGGGNDRIVGGGGSDLLAGGASDDVFVLVASGDSTLASMDMISDFQVGDKIEFTGVAGISQFSGAYTYTSSVGATVSALQSNTGVANKAVFFTDSTDGYLYIKGDGTGTSFDGSMVKLAGKTTVPTLSQLAGIDAEIAANNPGSVSISGTVTQGQTLTATASDADGVGTISFQWKAAGNTIAGATGSSYTLTQADVGKTITVAANYTDGHGTAESIISSATGAVVANFTNIAPRLNGGDGILTTAIGTSNDVGVSSTVQADGRILVAGYSDNNGSNNDFALVRYNTDGSLDTTFSGDGKVTTDFGALNERGQSVTVQADGRILVAGSSFNGSNEYFALVRYNADGSLDTTFSGDGMVTMAIGAWYGNVTSVALQADGRILVAGSSYNGSNEDFALVRYNTDGSLDTTFSGDGKVTTDFGALNDRGESVTVQADGRILVAGSSSIGTYWNFALVRYNPDGSLDTNFSGDGKLTTAIGTNSSGESVALQADGRILVAGSSGNGRNDFALARYNTDGGLDFTFSGDGKLTTSFSGALDPRTELGQSVALQADGRILVAGYSDNNGSNNDFALARYNADGSLDTTFSGDGKLTTAIGTSDDYGSSVTVQADGRILVAGSGYNGGQLDFALVRYNSDGSLDTSFAPPPLTAAATEHQPLIYTIPAGRFTDPDAGDILTYTATKTDGFALPGWLSFNAATQTFSGTPGDNDVGTLNLRVTASDQGGLSVSDTVTLTVSNVNDAPTFTKGSNLSIGEDAGSFISAGWATGISAGPANESIQALSFMVTGNTNSGLFAVGPTINPNNGNLSFTPVANANGTATISVKLTDNAGTANGGVDASPIQTFSITVTPVNDAPIITRPAATLTVVEDGASVLPFSGLTISDIDNATLLSATVLIEGWQPAGDVLSITNSPATLSLNLDTLSSTLTAEFTGPASIADIVTTLQGISIVSTTDALAGDRTVHLSVSDGENTVDLPAFAIATQGVNDLASLAITPGGTLSIGAGQTLSPLAAVTLGDPDSANLSGAVISISGYVAGDLLSVNAGATGIAASFNAGALTLTGTASIVQYQTVLGTLAFQGSQPGVRTLSLSANDGSGFGTPATLAVTVLASPVGTTGDDTLNGTASVDNLLGLAGNDTLTGGLGNDNLDGGSGFDTAQYSGNRADYTIDQGNWYHYTITDNNPVDGNDGIDTVFGIEQVEFADSSMALQTSGSWHGFKHRPITPFWAGTDWNVVDSQHDFNADSKNDVLLGKPDGSIALWLMDGSTQIAGVIFDPSPGRTLLDATTDYNGDGKTDLKWNESDGSSSYWLMDSGWAMTI